MTSQNSLTSSTKYNATGGAGRAVSDTSGTRSPTSLLSYPGQAAALRPSPVGYFGAASSPVKDSSSGSQPTSVDGQYGKADALVGRPQSETSRPSPEGYFGKA